MQGLLDSLAAIKLRQELSLEGEQRPTMPYDELIGMIRASGAAATDAAAEEVAGALCRAGLVLRFERTVYLRPLEVAEMVSRTLPSDPSRARAKMEEVEGELAEMEGQHRAIQRAASMWPTFWLGLGCLGVVGQVGLMAYLTWWELSWDVMEPIAYHLTLVYGAIAYLYFMATRGGLLEVGAFREYWQARLLRKRLAQQGFDLDRYTHLQKLRENYQRYLSAQADQAAGNQPSTSAHKQHAE